MRRLAPSRGIFVASVMLGSPALPVGCTSGDAVADDVTAGDDGDDGDRVQVYFLNRDAQNVLWDYVEVFSSGAPSLTPASDGTGSAAPCPDACHPCRNGGTCGWVQDDFLR